MKLRDCTHGKLIQDNSGLRVGMIIGVTNNHASGALEERSLPGCAIPLVQWSSGKENGIHHGNIKPL